MPKQHREPVRTCVACRQEAGKGSLLRLVRGAGGVVSIDRSGKAPGRGAYLHLETACLEVARRKGALERALKAPVGPEVWARLAPAPN
jgi:predicted RNA-binding protein YlxR (DUF448 family)